MSRTTCAPPCCSRHGEKAPVGPELRAIWVRRLAAATSRQERDGAVSLLLELHAYAELMPLLRKLVGRIRTTGCGRSARPRRRRAGLPISLRYG